MKTFFEQYYSLSKPDQNDFRQNVLNVCGIAYPTFYTWLRRRKTSNPSKQSQKLISQALNQPVETLFPSN